jgi:hypothetical protein
MSELEIELYRAAAQDPTLAREMTDVFSRSRRPGEVATVRRALVFGTRAARRTRAPLRVTRTVGREALVSFSNWVVRHA